MSSMDVQEHRTSKWSTSTEQTDQIDVIVACPIICTSLHVNVAQLLS